MDLAAEQFLALRDIGVDGQAVRIAERLPDMCDLNVR
jgi:hypothetical protein